jgi:hypothetical protein
LTYYSEIFIGIHEKIFVKPENAKYVAERFLNDKEHNHDRPYSIRTDGIILAKSGKAQEFKS